MSWKSAIGRLVADFGEDVVRRLEKALPAEATAAEARRAAKREVAPAAKSLAAKPAAKAPSAKPLAAKPKAAPAIVKKVSGANRRALSGAKYDAEKLARQYPDIAPPTLAVDPKSGKEFLQKTLSPEAQVFGEARRAAQKDIEAGNYVPYFNPEERFYADPAAYNLQGNTLVDVVPKRPETIAKYEEMAYDPAATSRLSSAYEAGLMHPGAADWYAMGQLEKAFVDQYGPEIGRRMFKERFADSMAATTGGADPTANLLMAGYGNMLKAAGRDIPKAPYELPSPIGGRYGATNMAMFDRLINKGEGLTTANPKRFNFSANFLGDRARSTIDEQMSELFAPGMTMPPGPSYGVFERALGDLAGRYNVPPANFQDVAWAGGKLAKTPKYRPKSMIEIVNEAIERTARVTGQDPEEVVAEALVKAKRPVYAKGGLAVKQRASR